MLLAPLPLLAPAAPVRDVAADERLLVTLINAERRAHGLGALTPRADLAAAGKRQAQRMAAKLEIWHNLNLENEISGWKTIGENVGWATTTATDLHRAFMESPEHKENILWPVFNEIGIGEVVASDGRIFVGEVFAQRRESVHRGSSVSAPTPARVRTLAVLLRIVGLDEPVGKRPGD